MKLKKPKDQVRKCKVCDAPIKTGGKRKCINCRRQEIRRKRSERAEKELERKKSSKKWKLREYKRLHAEAWKLWSLWIRSRNANADGYEYCYTCDKIFHYKELQAGHFIHNKLDFDERNIHPQCRQCNMAESYGGKGGNLAIYGIRLSKELGIEAMEKLELDSNTISYSKDDLEIIIVNLKNKLSET